MSRSDLEWTTLYLMEKNGDAGDRRLARTLCALDDIAFAEAISLLGEIWWRWETRAEPTLRRIYARTDGKPSCRPNLRRLAGGGTPREEAPPELC